jgi:predicted CopG family antitoxin
VIQLSKYATISVPVEIKKRLEELKGDKEWGEFFLDLCTENQRLKGKKAFEELRELLTDEDLEAIRKSSKEFRENFKLRSTS